MEKIAGLEALVPPPEGSSITIGTFDGLHVGHRALVATARAAASEHGVKSTVITWDRHPNETLRPDRVPPLLCSQDRKAELIADSGVDLLVVLRFCTELSRWPPERFVDQVLVDGLSARWVNVGSDWRFGHRAAGDVGLLERLGAARGFGVSAAPLVEIDGAPVSSSRVRGAVADAEMELASRLLGRPFELEGVVVHGDGRGGSLGYPTANLAVASELLRPPRGIYAGEARSAGGRWPAAISVGTNPTFRSGEEAPERVEAFLLDFHGDLYGASLRLGFRRRLRDERSFDSVEELVDQIARDVEETRALTC